MNKTAITLVVLCVALPCALRAESRSERKERVQKESEQASQVAGGDFFATSQGYEETFDEVLGFLKTQGHGIESASREAGQITTALQIKGGWRQTGTRVVITLIKDKGGSTRVRAVVTEQKRFKALQVEPWGDPSMDPKASVLLGEELRRILPHA